MRRAQIYQLERLWYAVGDDHAPFAQQLLRVMERLGDRYEIDELSARYEFQGQVSMTVPQALEIKEELARIDELIKQLEEARKTAQIGIIDLETLAEFAQPGDLQQLEALRQQVEELMREMAQRQGLEQSARGYQLTPQAYRTFQGKLSGADLQPTTGVAQLAGTRMTSWAKGRSNCRRRNPTNSAIRSRTSISLRP